MPEQGHVGSEPRLPPARVATAARYVVEPKTLSELMVTSPPLPLRHEIAGSSPTSATAWRAKRCLDVTLSAIALLLVLPLLVIGAIGISLSSPGPVLFRQPRVGRHGRLFTMFKLRTFPVDHVDDVHSLQHSDCPLWWGRLLRRTSIDELPQLWNVLRGEMSIVGPRPERPHFVDELSRSVPGYAARHRVPGGITGAAQVAGYWGCSSIAERVRHDNDYIERWSLGRDLAILVQTPVAAVRKGLRG